MAEIKFVREYVVNYGAKYEHTYYDIVYKSGRICTRYIADLPATVEKWLSGKKKTRYYDPVYKREEVIYKDD